MEVFCECTCVGKVFVPLKLVVRGDQLIKKESLEIVKEQIKDILKKNKLEYIDKYIPGKFGKNEKYTLVFVYSIIDKYEFDKNEWAEPHASIDLYEIKAMHKAPIIQTVNSVIKK